ncbi:hypothetical protein X801_03335 [Opisthorchis viverrini]|uniref:Uncharacterized protein n=2 Tax=Opisthorchis viverrini TaxID=6198 RepID=A0A1S8X238_OPIVI
MKQAAIRKFNSIRSPPLEPREPGLAKKSVPGPTSPMHFISLLLFSTFRRPMSVNTMTKAGVYLCIAAGVSLFFDFVHMPPSYFSNKYNLLNQIFVKWGWGWTCCGLTTFVIFSSFVYTGGNIQLIRAHLLRTVVGTAFWYIITGFINFIHDATGHCHPASLLLASGERPHRRTLCHRVGGVWLGFDVSGHCFLLVMCSLWIMEEVKCMQYWSRLADILKPYDTHLDADNLHAALSRRVTVNEIKVMRSAFCRLTGSIRFLFSFVSFLCILWDIMFVVTVVYFHTMPTKLLGTVLGVSCWFIAYRVVFPCTKNGKWFGFAPGMPGESPLEFMPR